LVISLNSFRVVTQRAQRVSMLRSQHILRVGLVSNLCA